MFVKNVQHVNKVFHVIGFGQSSILCSLINHIASQEPFHMNIIKLENH